ncbi:DegV family protein [Angelakisella massiliensis]|uniref:DegV family protein n=1 Tax=Angelakisella massiliensis TaxID=1871018 RepID=UPI0008F86D9E|nr:DegV family protein [Angelakisella massiliensis]
MEQRKIAILMDSGGDVPADYRRRWGIYCVPLSIHYKDSSYKDGVDITAEEIYDRFQQEIPKTSLPSSSEVEQMLEQIWEDGYRQVLIINISSGLSGTMQVMKAAAEEFGKLEFRMIDTKNIGIGAGFTVMLARELAEQGLEMEEIAERLERSVKETKVYFCVSTLEYLRKGGRIGLVSATLGTMLGIKPVISCNEDGVYYTVQKARGRKASLQCAVRLAADFAKGHRCRLAVMHGGAPEEAEEVKKELLELLPGQQVDVEGQITPVLVVHTGPGLMGIGVQRLD